MPEAFDIERLNDGLRYLQEEVAPHAAEIDAHPESLRQALGGLCERELMALKAPIHYGGIDLAESEFRSFQRQIARFSGSLAFLQTQHQSAVAMLARSDNEALKEATLPHMGNGSRLIGIGFSQLRRSGPPIMLATPTDHGFLLSGHVPWVTGYSFYPEFLVGATLPDSRSLFAVVPLQSQPGIRVSEPMRLAAMESAQTVTVDFDEFPISMDLVAFFRPEGWIRENDMINIALQGNFAFGCVLAALDVLQQVFESKGFDFVARTREALENELHQCLVETGAAHDRLDPNNPKSVEERLKLRAWAIDLAVRAAHACVTASSGAANSANHPAQRIYREALVYTVSAQTTAIMEATLARLVR
jgi:alkylation response protein AidB-like acyl-CoA dehydrogenase